MTTSTDRFRSLHADGIFVMPNPYDLGSARLLAALGFPALASTSSGFAATLGRLDMTVGREELLDHVGALTAATDLPLNVDSERCYRRRPGRCHRDGRAAWPRPAPPDARSRTGTRRPTRSTRSTSPPNASARLPPGAANTGLVLTARCENHLHGINDLDDTIARLQAYVAAGAEVVYAPGLVDLDQIATVVNAVGVPVNVLILPGGPSVAQLGEAGARRISTGGCCREDRLRRDGRRRRTAARRRRGRHHRAVPVEEARGRGAARLGLRRLSRGAPERGLRRVERD